jgi:flagellar protein FlbT
MAFWLKLKPQERVLIGGASLRNGRSRVELFIENEVPVLREPDILDPGSVRTPCERIHMALQLVYLDAAHRPDHLETYRALVADVVEAVPSCRPLIAVIDECVQTGRIYQAIRNTRPLLNHERELISHA